MESEKRAFSAGQKEIAVAYGLLTFESCADFGKNV